MILLCMYVCSSITRLSPWSFFPDLLLQTLNRKKPVVGFRRFDNGFLGGNWPVAGGSFPRAIGRRERFRFGPTPAQSGPSVSPMESSIVQWQGKNPCLPETLHHRF